MDCSLFGVKIASTKTNCPQSRCEGAANDEENSESATNASEEWRRPGAAAPGGADARRDDDHAPALARVGSAPPGLPGPPPGEAQASLSHRSRGLAAQRAGRAEGAGRPEPSSRPTRRRRSRPVGQPAPEGNDSGGLGPSHRAPGLRAPGLIGDIDASTP